MTTQLPITHNTDHFFKEDQKIIRDNMLEQGYIEIPYSLSKFFGNSRWIHEDELKALKEFIFGAE